MTDAATTTLDGSLESPKDAGRDEAGRVNRWILEIDLADKYESEWRKTANRARDIYRGKTKQQNSFNILWANTEVLRPNLYNSQPNPDVRRRYRDADPTGKEVAEVIERNLSFEADACDVDSVFNKAVFDSCLPGRGTARVRFEPYFEDEMLASAKVYPEHVPWDMYRRGSASSWDDLPWIAYIHHLTKAQIKEQFPGFEDKVQYDVVISGASEEKANAEPEVFKRTLVYEIWNKEGREILWIARSYKDAPMLVEPDKLNLKGFFDMPRPIYAIDDTSTLEPVCEYTLYEEQAKELNRVTKRINKLTDALKVRGIYDSTLGEMATLMQSDDNDLIPTVDNTMVLAAGGFDKAIWLMPIEQIAKVLAQLYIQREQVKMTIYEILGISDILRGSTDPNETLGAQELKAQTGSVRMQRRQRDVQRFARDLYRIMAELITEHYTPEMMSIISGIPVTPEMIQIMQRDLLRGIKVDIETDSTIAADQAKVRQDVKEIFEGVGGFVQSFGPAIESGAIGIEAAKKILGSLIRKAKLGRDVEDAIEQDMAQPPPPKPDPEMAKLQAQQQSEAARMQMEGQKQQQQLQLEGAKLQAQDAQNTANQQLEREKLAFEAQQRDLDRQLQLQMKREEMQMQAELKREEMQMNAELKVHEAEKKGETAIETEKLRSKASNKPAVQLGGDDVAESVAKSLAESQTGIAEALTSALESIAQSNEKAMAQVASAIEKSAKKTVTMKTSQGKTLQATIN